LFTGTGSIAERVLHCFLPKIPLISRDEANSSSKFSWGPELEEKNTQTMADKVIEALIHPTVLNQIVPILS
jgi:hypothetical protein